MAFELLYIAIEFQVNAALQIQYKRQIAIAELSHFSLPIFFFFCIFFFFLYTGEFNKMSSEAVKFFRKKC